MTNIHVHKDSHTIKTTISKRENSQEVVKNKMMCCEEFAYMYMYVERSYDIIIQLLLYIILTSYSVCLHTCMLVSTPSNCM